MVLTVVDDRGGRLDNSTQEGERRVGIGGRGQEERLWEEKQHYVRIYWCLLCVMGSNDPIFINFTYCAGTLINILPFWLIHLRFSPLQSKKKGSIC